MSHTEQCVDWQWLEEIYIWCHFLPKTVVWERIPNWGRRCQVSWNKPDLRVADLEVCFTTYSGYISHVLSHITVTCTINPKISRNFTSNPSAYHSHHLIIQHIQPLVYIRNQQCFYYHPNKNHGVFTFRHIISAQLHCSLLPLASRPSECCWVHPGGVNQFLWGKNGKKMGK